MTPNFNGLVAWFKTTREDVMEQEYQLVKIGFTGHDVETMETRDRVWFFERLVKEKEAEKQAYDDVMNKR